MTALVSGARGAALVVADHAVDAIELAALLDMLGLLQAPARPASVRPRIRPHPRHSRGSYQPGCPQCREVNRRYAERWRLGRAVTYRVRFAVLEEPSGRGRGRAYEGQLAMEIGGKR